MSLQPSVSERLMDFTVGDEGPADLLVEVLLKFLSFSTEPRDPQLVARAVEKLAGILDHDPCQDLLPKQNS